MKNEKFKALPRDTDLHIWHLGIILQACCVWLPLHISNREAGSAAPSPRCCCVPAFLGIWSRHSQEEIQNKNPSRQLQNWLIDLTFRIGYSNT